jgi:hypothetical protein
VNGRWRGVEVPDADDLRALLARTSRIVKEVLDACETGEDAGSTSKQSDENAEKLSLYIKTLYEAMEKSPGNVKLEEN